MKVILETLITLSLSTGAKRLISLIIYVLSRKAGFYLTNLQIRFD